MKVTIDIDCTPQEARAFFGLPDPSPVNEMLVAELKRRTAENMETLADPERFFSQMMNAGAVGMDQFQKLMAAAMRGPDGEGKS
ncbi:MAG: DUF6489 family protein [Pseudomonadota bacterium]